MIFEEKIITNSSIRQKNLMRPAKVAYENPDTGVTINKKGAYYLITTRDVMPNWHMWVNTLVTSSRFISFEMQSRPQLVAR